MVGSSHADVGRCSAGRLPYRADLPRIADSSKNYGTQTIANVPFAAIGGLVSFWITGQYLSPPSATGFIAVFGVVMLNGIVLVSIINELHGKGLSVPLAVPPKAGITAAVLPAARARELGDYSPSDTAGWETNGGTDDVDPNYSV